jgi:indole-3-glycerol phosphate synthase
MSGPSTVSASSDFLLRMADASRRRLAAALTECNESDMRHRAELRSAAVPLTVSQWGFDLIAEVKRRSPSGGSLAPAEQLPRSQAQQYADAGAAAISVLTEPEQFAGDLADLEQVVDQVSALPAMRKDFLIAPYQILEARAAGASGVLLIAAMLDKAELRDMLHIALGLGMFVLVEAFDPVDLENCLPVLADAGPAISNEESGRGSRCRILIGVNCRNLRSLEVEFSRFEQMVGRLPVDIPWVAESGVTTVRHAASVASLGYRLALVGTALMRASDPVAAVQSMLVAGRSAARDK